MCTYRKAKIILIFLLLVSLSNRGWCGKIIYPWNATTAIVKAGEVFTVWFDAEEGENIESILLRGPYNSVSIPSDVQETGSWIYDEESGFSYNTRISVSVPSTTPMERYDLVLNTTSGEQVSQSSVKVIREYQSEYAIFHISDTHICDESYRKEDGVPRRLDWLSALVDMANIIGPEMVFLTGDNVNSRSWDDGNAEYLTSWPSTQERINFYYEGSHETDRRGVYDFDAAAFSVNGNHDQYERPADGKETKNKYEFWNKYHGLRTHHFSYGDSRFMAFSDDFGEDAQVQAERHSTWLNAVGPGSLRLIYKHYYHIVPQPWATDHNIQLGLCGHNHHKGWENPYAQGTTDMYIANFTEYSTFNLIRVDSLGNYQVENNLVAIENPQDDPSQFRSKLTLEYTESNDGTSSKNTAILVNKFDIRFSEARVRFVMPKGQYTISIGRVDQVIKNDSLSVLDVRIPIEANSSTSIHISQNPNRPID